MDISAVLAPESAQNPPLALLALAITGYSIVCDTQNHTLMCLHVCAQVRYYSFSIPVTDCNENKNYIKILHLRACTACAEKITLKPYRASSTSPSIITRMYIS